MKHVTRTRTLKSLLLGSAALTLVGLSPALSQERPQMQGGQSPAATQSKGAEPAAREGRGEPARGDQKSQRGAKGEGGSPSGAQPGDKGPRATQNRDDDRKPAKANQAQDRESPSRKDNQAKDTDSKPNRHQVQDRDGKRDRDQAKDRDGRRDRDEARERDSKRDQNQAQDRDTKRDRDQARDRDGARDRDLTRDADRRDRDGGRAGERQVTEQQRTRITTSIRQANVRPVRNVNFSVSVGTVVPASVRFYQVTPAIVEVYPEYRGYEFVLVEEEIVIVEPRTRRIVTVIDTGGSGRAASHARGRLSLTEKQREVVRRAAIQRHTTGSARTTRIEREYVIGDDIPASVEFEIFPDTIYAEVPEIRSYRYVVRDDDVYVIDPTERRVIEIIR
ncbi:MAG: DUF1236 domain-containing protein [Pseudorhodoplanes sp.]